MILKTLLNKDNLRIALDLDDTIFDFIGPFSSRFNHPDWKDQVRITKLVYRLQKDKQFWENLPLLERPDFKPTIYSTKRINSKTYTRNNLRKFDLPICPIYQTLLQTANKADIIKGRCDVLIDDSAFNVRQCLSVGLPAILISRPHNMHITDLPRVNRLCLDEIWEVFQTIFINNGCLI